MRIRLYEAEEIRFYGTFPMDVQVKLSNKSDPLFKNFWQILRNNYKEQETDPMYVDMRNKKKIFKP